MALCLCFPGRLGRHRASNGAASPNGEGSYALGDYASEPFRHYAIAGGVNQRKPHGVGGLVVGEWLGAGESFQIILPKKEPLAVARGMMAFVVTVVCLNSSVYQKGISLIKQTMAATEERLERNPLLPKWDILIRLAIG